ncbi:hypothetical protein MBLNU230_g1867t1 [Neophaeotheca triangularis]
MSPANAHAHAHAPGSRGPSPPRARSPGPSKLQKTGPAHERAPSGQYLAPNPTHPPQPTLQDLKQDYAGKMEGGAPSPLMPPPAITGGSQYRSNSHDRSSRPGSAYGSRPSTPVRHPSGQLPPASPASDKKDKEKKGWFGKSKKKGGEEKGPVAWIAGHPQKMAYDAEGLVNGRPARELWDEMEGNCFVYLFPRESGKGASFRVDSGIFGSSSVLLKMAFGDSNVGQTDDRRQAPVDARMQAMGLHDGQHQPHGGSSSSGGSQGRYSGFSDVPSEVHLYLPVRLSGVPTPYPDPTNKTAVDDLQTLVDYRNLFAFLSGQSIVATEKRSSFFHIFMTMASMLKGFEFTNLDGSTFGEVASSSFDNYVEELGLADVRSSREATIEGIVLGERMRSVALYNEAFTHCAGKHDDIVTMKSPKYGMISPITQNRLSRAAMDLDKRTASIRLILEDFDFPAVFAGIGTSKMSDERREGVRFDQWKDHFFNMRKFFLGTCKQRYGNWPPKASSKKNELATSGLNRIVLRDLYHDLSSLYDLLADRANLTTRTVDGIDHSAAREEPTVRALRALLSEYDRSSPPVKPPVPFDLPTLPSLKSARPDFGTGDKRADLKAIQKKLKDEELTTILRKSWNGDAILTPFVKSFCEMETRASKGCTIGELVDQRIGQWIFMYVVLQALPMLACDAPGLKHTKGVEYFLSQPPRSGVPWASQDVQRDGKRSWYSVGGTTGGGGVVSLPSDIVEHGVEGIYRRSHCWQAAERWSADNPILNSALHDKEEIDAERMAAAGHGPRDSHLPAPPSAPNGFLAPNSRSSSPARSSKRNSYMGLGLEALPLPAGVTPDGSAPVERPRSSQGTHAVDASKTFDAILGGGAGEQAKKGKKK